MPKVQPNNKNAEKWDHAATMNITEKMLKYLDSDKKVWQMARVAMEFGLYADWFSDQLAKWEGEAVDQDKSEEYREQALQVVHNIQRVFTACEERSLDLAGKNKINPTVAIFAAKVRLGLIERNYVKQDTDLKANVKATFSLTDLHKND